MSYTALYRKYRPSNFSNVVGQKIVVNILKNSLMTGHISHAYLFAGPRGTGKTSIAKIFAKAVNCLDFHDDICGKCENCINLEKNDIDIIEIDAASNNGVEEIRTIRDNAKLLPSFCKYKIYIIDEVHMLSTGAFNALLKTLEEPPAHVIFILATTEINKIPLTILSRCQRFDFSRLSENDISERLKYILSSENKSLSEDVISYISNVADGGLRDAINLLDQVLSLNKQNISVSDIEQLSGKISDETIKELFIYIKTVDYKKMLELLDNISSQGKNLLDLVNKMLIFLRDVSINIQIPDYFNTEYSNILNKYSFMEKQNLTITKMLTELSLELKNSSNQKMLVEIYLLNIFKLFEGPDQYKNTTEMSEVKISDTSENLVSDNEKNSVNNLKNYDKIKKIRINNVLCEANKDILLEYKNKLTEINDYMSDKKYNSIVVLLNSANIVCASEKYILFSFDNLTNLELFYENLLLIESLVSSILEKNVKIVSVLQHVWENIKNQYIFKKKNGEKYIFIEENEVKLDCEVIEDDAQSFANGIFGEESVNMK